MRRTALIVLVGVLLTGNAFAEKTGNDWKQMEPSARMTYIWGVADAWQNLRDLFQFANPEEKTLLPILDALVKCMANGMTYGQISAIVEKHMENNPSEWHYTMPHLMWSAMTKDCIQMYQGIPTPPAKK